VSFELDGAEQTHDTIEPAISADGKAVAYRVAIGDRRGGPFEDRIYLYHRPSGRTEWIDAGPFGLSGDGASSDPSISGDARFVAFTSSSENLIPGTANNRFDVFVRDRRTRELERIPNPQNGHSFEPSITPGGRFVAFRSSRPGNFDDDVFVHDRKTGATELIPRSTGEPSIAAGGRFVAFVYGNDVLVHDRELDTSEEISGDNWYSRPAISASGRFVAYTGHGGDTRAGAVLVHDRKTGRTERVSLARDGGRGNDVSGGASITPKGRYVAFASRSSNLVPKDTNDAADIFVRDRRTDVTRRVSVSSARAQANGESGEFGPPPTYDFVAPSISGGGRFVAFSSRATNLAPGDTDGFNYVDVFVRGPLAP
jgi:Tol biopolymer transport system component